MSPTPVAMKNALIEQPSLCGSGRARYPPRRVVRLCAMDRGPFAALAPDGFTLPVSTFDAAMFAFALFFCFFDRPMTTMLSPERPRRDA
jgi:hypothetical protein